MAISKTKVALVSALVILALLVPTYFVAGDAGFLGGIGTLMAGARGTGARGGTPSAGMDDGSGSGMDVGTSGEGVDSAALAWGNEDFGWMPIRMAGELADELPGGAASQAYVAGAGTGADAEQGGAEEAAVPAPKPKVKWVPACPATDGERLATGLVEDDSVNVLILGLDREAYLLDSMGVVSISATTKEVKIIMFPRDTYIAYSAPVLAEISKIGHAKLPGEFKINNVYNVAKNTTKVSDAVYNDNRFEERGFDFLTQVIYEKFDIWVDDFVRINTFGFVKLVDMFGGVRVTVPMRMRYKDPDQNLNIDLQKGTYVLNGTQAEGFVRFRQGYDAKGKLTVYADRNKNQIAFLKAFYEQHGRLSNIGKIPDLISLLKKNVVHSVSAEDIFTKYVDILTAVVEDKYEFVTHEFTMKDKKINGSNYLVVIG